MKKLQIMMLLMLSVGMVKGSASSAGASDDLYPDASAYSARLNEAFDARAAGNGYESGSDELGAIRKPRRKQVGLDQEAFEYLGTQRGRPDFVADSKEDRLIMKIREYLAKLDKGEISEEQFCAVVGRKVDNYRGGSKAGKKVDNSDGMSTGDSLATGDRLVK